MDRTEKTQKERISPDSAPRLPHHKYISFMKFLFFDDLHPTQPLAAPSQAPKSDKTSTRQGLVGTYPPCKPDETASPCRLMLQYPNAQYSPHPRSHARGVKHDADASPNALGGKVPRKLAPDDAIAPVTSAHASPVNPEFRSALAPRGRNLGDVSDALSEVEFHFLLRVDSLDLDEGGVVVLITQSSLVPEDGAIDVQACRLSILLRHCRCRSVVIVSNQFCSLLPNPRVDSLLFVGVDEDGIS